MQKIWKKFLLFSLVLTTLSPMKSWAKVLIPQSVSTPEGYQYFVAYKGIDKKFYLLYFAEEPTSGKNSAGYTFRWETEQKGLGFASEEKLLAYIKNPVFEELGGGKSVNLTSEKELLAANYNFTTWDGVVWEAHAYTDSEPEESLPEETLPEEGEETGLLEALKSWFMSVVEAVKSLKSAVVGKLESLVSGVAGLVVEVKSFFGEVSAFIKGLPAFISSLVVPYEGYFEEKLGELNEIFPFVEQVKSLFQSLTELFVPSEAPAISIKLPERYGGTMKVLDLKIFTPYKPQMDALAGGFLWVSYLWLLVKRLPEILGGAGMATESSSKTEPKREDRKSVV